MNRLYIIHGGVPSKKNSRINTRSGRSFPSKEYSEWHDAAAKEIQAQGITTFDKVKFIEIECFFGTNRRQDLDNKLSSILDLLKDISVIKDDCWQVVPEITVIGNIDRENPRVEISIIESGDYDG